MESKDKPAQPEQKPEVKPSPCETQVKEYTQCLTSLSYYWSSCNSERKSFKACNEFDAWLEQSMKQKK